MTDDENNGSREGYIGILPTRAAAAKYSTAKGHQKMRKSKGAGCAPDRAKMSIVPHIFGSRQRKATGAIRKMAGLAAYMSQSNQKGIRHVWYGILIGIVIRIARAGDDLRCIHENREVIRYVCASINVRYGVVGVGNVVHGAVNTNIGWQEGAVGALNGAGVMGVPDTGAIRASSHHALAFRKAEEAHKCERRHGSRTDGGRPYHTLTTET